MYMVTIYLSMANVHVSITGRTNNNVSQICIYLLTVYSGVKVINTYLKTPTKGGTCINISLKLLFVLFQVCCYYMYNLCIICLLMREGSKYVL